MRLETFSVQNKMANKFKKKISKKITIPSKNEFAYKNTIKII